MTEPSGPRLSHPSATLGKNTSTATTRQQILLNTLAALLIAGTYTWAVLTTGGGQDPALVSLPLVLGYGLGALTLLYANINRIPLSLLALIPFAAAFNIVLGQLIGFSGIPLYLDSVATILVAILAGPTAGVLTGITTNLAWGLTINPTTIPFAAGAATIGLLAGLAGQYGLHKKLWAMLTAGFTTGIVAAFLGAPIAAFVYGGGQGVGTGSVVAALQAAGNSLLQATTFQSLLSDPLDKTVAFLLVFLILKGIPTRIKSQLKQSTP